MCGCECECECEFWRYRRPPSLLGRFDSLEVSQPDLPPPPQKVPPTIPFPSPTRPDSRARETSSFRTDRRRFPKTRQPSASLPERDPRPLLIPAVPSPFVPLLLMLHPIPSHPIPSHPPPQRHATSSLSSSPPDPQRLTCRNSFPSFPPFRQRLIFRPYMHLHSSYTVVALIGYHYQALFHRHE
ncbi:hypothetical protein L249_7793 [Ophiocordyceps polyrhachis-furcata BCC 54312]|uniref:Uncharacterized protein n=1 Tax=Ophiocordyceps polyrhachis-furcata BCC 54312 TaxID=1330021 RepID=A0A367L1A8_9HYPO|nr:hypothetical protein L249_7793 [Ophiocordyceps polyrhachis-furcata BCC 54312]